MKFAFSSYEFSFTVLELLTTLFMQSWNVSHTYASKNTATNQNEDITIEYTHNVDLNGSFKASSSCDLFSKCVRHLLKLFHIQIFRSTIHNLVYSGRLGSVLCYLNCQRIKYIREKNLLLLSKCKSTLKLIIVAAISVYSFLNVQNVRYLFE